MGDTPRTLKYGHGRASDGAIARSELLMPYKMQDQLRINLAEMPAHQLIAEALRRRAQAPTDQQTSLFYPSASARSHAALYSRRLSIATSRV